MLKRKKIKKPEAKIQAKKFKIGTQFKPLRLGDSIEIIAPGSSTSKDTLEKGIEVFKGWGYQVACEDNLIEPQIFLSNTDTKRFLSFKKAITNSNSKVVWCLRGGYGSIRLLPLISKMKKPKNIKLLIGLSDISSLHIYINQKWNWPTLHGPLLDRLALGKLSVDNIFELRQALENPEYVTEFDNLIPLNKAAQKQKKIKSQIVGGNLMVVTSTLGTEYQINAKNKIIFLEELCERSYRVDRCLQQMKQAGVFNKAAAVVFGDFTDCHEPNKDNYIMQVITEFFSNMKLPVFSGVETGHGEKQRPLFFNTETHLTCGVKPKMSVYSPFKNIKV